MVHSTEDLEMIKKYEDSTDLEVLDFVNHVLSGDDKLNYITVAFMPDSAAQRIKELTGKQVMGSRVVLDLNAIRHIVYRHGPDGKQDHSMRSLEDIARIGYVIMNYDCISYDGITTTGYLDEKGNPAPVIKIKKRIDGTYYVVEAVNQSKKKKNYVVTAYISKK